MLYTHSTLCYTGCSWLFTIMCLTIGMMKTAVHAMVDLYEEENINRKVLLHNIGPNGYGIVFVIKTVPISIPRLGLSV